MRNSLGKEIPEVIEGYGLVQAYKGAFAAIPDLQGYAPAVKVTYPTTYSKGSKMVNSMEELFKTLKIRSGMTLSFHHHLRNGDAVANLVLATAAKLGLKDLNISMTGTFAVHAPLIEHIKNGVVTSLRSSGLYGPIAKAISGGILDKPVILHTHGGRPRSMKNGELKVDVAFIAAPAADIYGNITGILGPAACGSLGYAFTDVDCASKVVAITDHIVKYPLFPISIPQHKVDYIVKIDSIGDAKGIVSGTTLITKDPVGLNIADYAAKVIKASGLLKEGFSFQTGAGGASLATAYYVRKMMEEAQIAGSFAIGGITGYMVEMLEKGFFKTLFDVQDFDLESVKSLSRNPNHMEISADLYANPFNSGCVVNNLDVVILGATEVDTDFNVNVITGSDGVIMGASGGHPDAAAGAKLAIIVTNLMRSRQPIVVDKVITATTPGETIDVVVTEYGIAVNPLRQDLKARLLDAGLPIKEIHKLKKIAEDISGVPNKIENTGRVVALVEYRDGTIIDVVRQCTG